MLQPWGSKPRGHQCVDITRLAKPTQLGQLGINVDGEDAGTISDPELLMEVRLGAALSLAACPLFVCKSLVQWGRWMEVVRVDTGLAPALRLLR